MTTKQEVIQLAKQTAAIKNTRLAMEAELAALDAKEARRDEVMRKALSAAAPAIANLAEMLNNAK